MIEVTSGYDPPIRAHLMYKGEVVETIEVEPDGGFIIKLLVFRNGNIFFPPGYSVRFDYEKPLSRLGWGDIEVSL